MQTGIELVGDHAPRATALFMEKALQQSLGGFGVAAKLGDFVEDVAPIMCIHPAEAAFSILGES